jgi:two-component system chemotaxis response regulator CheY
MTLMALRILVVDDSTTIRNLVANCLKQSGHAVTACSDGAEALRCLNCGAFDLIITDFNMPVMDGIALIRQARTITTARQTPILVLTTEMSPDKKSLARQAGASGWLLKPFNPNLLLEAIRRLQSTNGKVAGRS